MPAARKHIHSRPVRLQVLLARCGFGSRRACEEYIESGRVTVDGETVTKLGARVDVLKQKVEVDGESIRPDRAVCYMVNKPKGMLCTNSDPAGRARVIDLFPSDTGRVFPIGRLDENSVGLLLVTNDGDLSHRLAHPRFRVPKVYQVQVAGKPTREIIDKLRQGMYFSDGRFKVDGIKWVGARGQSTLLEVTLSEGQNREIRRLFARVGHKVMKLERVSFGPLKLRNVPLGRFRKLTRDEMRILNDYIEHGERNTESKTKPTRKTSHRKSGTRDTDSNAASSTGTNDRKSARRPARVVEISPIAAPRGHDITGRKRSSQKADQATDRRRVDDADDEERTPLAAHPALIASKQAGKKASGGRSSASDDASNRKSTQGRRKKAASRKAGTKASRAKSNRSSAKKKSQEGGRKKKRR